MNEKIYDSKSEKHADIKKPKLLYIRSKALVLLIFCCK